MQVCFNSSMPISDCQVRDPRIRRTRKLLQGALGSLMREKSFDEISVHDITDAATVNRATFYDHYADKFALLEAMVAGGFHEWLDERQLRYQAGCPTALRAIIRATVDYLTEAHAAGACVRQTAFEPLMDAAIAAAIRRLLEAGLRTESGSIMGQSALAAAAASAAITGGVKQWFSSTERAEVDDFVTGLGEMILPMLEIAAREGLPAVVEAHSH
jgi:AcrR family transcriptional regulator